MSEFSHWNEEGRAKMVDISQKDISTRTAVAQSTISLSNELFEEIQSGGLKKETRSKLRKLPHNRC